MTTVSRRINGERLVVLGWSRAILLQMAHPLIAAGVIEHSAFRSSPLVAARRLAETIRAMLGLTFGSAREQSDVVARILAIHARVHGTLRHTVGRFPVGTAYSAEDPDLVRWVHLTLLDSTIRAYEATVAIVPTHDRDAYCAEAAPIAIALGARPETVPTTWNALTAAVAEMYDSGTLAVGPDAREIATSILDSGFSRLAGPAGWANRTITVGWLPEALRAQYGYAWTDRDARRHERILRWLRRSRGVAPRVLAEWRDARRPAPR